MSFETGLLIAAGVLLGNAFFVGAEFALVSARRSNIELKALEGSRAAKLCLSAMEQVSLMLAGAQLGITLCSLIFGAVGEPLVAHALEGPLHQAGLPDELLHPVSFVIALTLMVYLHVVIGEMVPKNLSLASSTRAALVLVPMLLFTVRALKPVVVGLNAMANACVRLLGVEPRDEIRSSFSRDEVAGFVKESHREGLLSKEEEQLLSGTLDLEERTIERITLSLDQVVTTSARPTWSELEKLTAQTGFSRFPVRSGRGAHGKLKGYVHVKDLLQYETEEGDHALPARCVRALSEVQARTSLRQTLATMQRAGAHIAQVIDSKGTVLGVVMLEDVLEELVGPIRDETQKRPAA
ncbi:MAG TPA: hemolysin family protein [Candidatus Saccharimonadales bacterium]|nr:hemolysin family protein [Candidatus Saccharimonadales bacterium]